MYTIKDKILRTLDYLKSDEIIIDINISHGNWDRNKEGNLKIKDENIKQMIYNNPEKYNSELTYSFNLEGVDYKITIGNIPTKYTLNAMDIVNEYCKNIIRHLYKYGYRFDDGKVIDFQEYLV